MKTKRHYFRKITAVVLTMLAFSFFVSYSDSATASIISNDVVIVNDDGQRVAVAKSELMDTGEEDGSLETGEEEAVEIGDDDLTRIARQSQQAAEDFNRRNGGGTDSDILIEDENGDLINPAFADDWSLILINKDHLIPEDYSFELATITDKVRSDVRCAGALVDMIRAAREDGVYLYVASPFRDLQRQTYVFERKVKSIMAEGYDHDEAYELASEVVAPPGTSEHQIGLAFDFVCDGYWKLDEGFADTDGGRWLKENAPDYGFILRYPRGREDITKIEFEPWHYRYVGVDAAREMRRLDLTLEEYDEYIGLV